MGLKGKPLAVDAPMNGSTNVRSVGGDQLPGFRIFVSSPGDVSTERKITERIIGRLGGEFRERGRLEPYFWEYEPMRHQNDFQFQIPPTSDFDVVICILWSRLGTPVTAQDGRYYSSGTEYEVSSAWAAWQATGRPELLIYINETPAQIRQFPDSEFNRMVEQLKALKKFIGEYCIDPDTGQTKGAFTAYQDLGQFEDLLEKHLAKLIDMAFPKKSFPGVPVQAQRATWTGQSPFRGLAPFDFEHAPIFFGRTRAVGEVLARLKKQMAEVEDAKASRSTDSEIKPAAFVLVSAMSGVGKSSLVRAGVLPLLVEPGNGVALWRHAVMRPSEASGDLFDGLARALCRKEALPELINGEMTAEKIADLLRRTPAGIEFGLSAALELVAGGLRQQEEQDSRSREREYRQAGRIADADEMVRRITHLTGVNKIARLVLVIDQLEEVFTLDRINPEIRFRFVTALGALARSGKVYVIATLRSDFFARCAEVPLLAELSQGDGLYHLLPPDSSEIGQMIRQPALVAGLRFETHPETKERLDERLRDAATRSPEALPLLQFCLEELYKAQARRGENSRLLTHADYDDMGGVEGALAKRAEEIFLALAPSDQDQFNHVMRGITTVALEETTVSNRRWAEYQELVKPAGAQRFVDAFLNPEARLFVIDRTDDGRVVVSATHEALLTRWDRLRIWLEENRENLRMRAQVSADARRWRDSGRNPDYLYTGGLPLAKAREIAIEGFLDQDERDFVELSSAKAHAELERKKHITHRVMAGISAALVAAVVFGVVSFRQYRRAERAKVQFDQEAKRATLARNEAEKLINFMTFDLRDKLKPIGRLDLLADVNRRVRDYYEAFTGQNEKPEILNQRAAALANQGDIERDQGDLGGALKCYQDSLSIRQKLVTKDSSNSEWERDLSIGYEKVGDVAFAQGDLTNALLSFKNALAIKRKLSDTDPGKVDWQQELSVSFEKIGNVLDDRGDLDGALQNYRDCLAIRKKLSAEAPESADRQRNLSDSWLRVGDVLSEKGDLSGTIESYRSCLAIREKLTASDPSNAGWQRDLSVSLERLGIGLAQKGDLDDALQRFQDSLAIRAKLTSQDPSNTEWKRELSLSYEDIGNTLKAKGDLAGALRNYRDSLAIKTTLANGDPTNADGQRDLSIAFSEIGAVLTDQRDLTNALQNLRSCLAIAQRLSKQDPANAGWQRDLSIAFERVADVLKAQNDLSGALQNYRECLAIRQKLIAEGPTNALWESDLTIGYGEVGAVLFDLGEHAGAMQNLRTGLEICGKLVLRDPTNAEWQSGLALACYRVAVALRRPDKSTDNEARLLLEKARDILAAMKNRAELGGAEGSLLKRDMSNGDKRFKIALSFPGEHRAFVAQVAAELSMTVGRDFVLYDLYSEAEFARPNLDIHLPNL
jgi:eukaryotic-like serine/threonine-protein kinase